MTALIFLGAMGAGIGALHWRAGAEAQTESNPPVTVTILTLKPVKSYRVLERFAGRLEPARQTRLAFELSGVVQEVLVEEGAKVKAGDAIARLDTAKLTARRNELLARKRELEARLGLAKVTLKRQETLKAKGHSSVQSYDEARFSVAQLSASIQAVEASLSSVAIDLDKSVLRAPFAGTVAARHIDEGAIVQPGTGVADILETGRREARIGVAVNAAEALSIGETYALSAGEKSLTAKLIALRPDLQTGTRTVTALFELTGGPEAGDGLPFGDIVVLGLGRDITADGFWIPLSALSEGRKGLWSVFTVLRDGTQEMVAREAVEVLHTSEGRVFVRGTLKAGTEVIINGTNRIIPGQLIARAEIAGS